MTTKEIVAGGLGSLSGGQVIGSNPTHYVIQVSLNRTGSRVREYVLSPDEYRQWLANRERDIEHFLLTGEEED